MQEIKTKKENKNLPTNKLLAIITVILLIVLIVLIALAVKGNGSGEKKNENVYSSDDKKTEKGNTFEENTYPEVASLVDQYFIACAANDFTVLDQIVSEMGEEEKALIQRKSEYVEVYNDVKSYIKLGPIENSYLVFATYNMKFKNLETAVPGMETLYIRTDDSGRMFIYKGQIEAEVSSYIDNAVKSDDAVKIIEKVNNEYLNVLADHKEVLEFIEKFEGESELVAQAKQLAESKASTEAKAREEAEAKARAEEAEKARQEQEAAAANAAQNAQQTDESVTIIQTINVRASNSEESEKIAHLFVGDVVKRTSVTEDGWSQIKFNGDSYGYTKSEYLSTFKSTEDKVRPTTIVNIRSECSETANIIGQLDTDLTYTRNVIYDNGWSQIALDGSVGYVKTEYLTKD